MFCTSSSFRCNGSFFAKCQSGKNGPRASRRGPQASNQTFVQLRSFDGSHILSMGLLEQVGIPYDLPRMQGLHHCHSSFTPISLHMTRNTERAHLYLHEVNPMASSHVWKPIRRNYKLKGVRVSLASLRLASKGTQFILDLILLL